MCDARDAVDAARYVSGLRLVLNDVIKVRHTILARRMGIWKWRVRNSNIALALPHGQRRMGYMPRPRQPFRGGRLRLICGRRRRLCGGERVGGRVPKFNAGW